jgi:hypothetical protein
LGLEPVAVLYALIFDEDNGNCVFVETFYGISPAYSLNL